VVVEPAAALPTAVRNGCNRRLFCLGRGDLALNRQYIEGIPLVVLTTDQNRPTDAERIKQLGLVWEPLESVRPEFVGNS